MLEFVGTTIKVTDGTRIKVTKKGPAIKEKTTSKTKNEPTEIKKERKRFGKKNKKGSKFTLLVCFLLPIRVITDNYRKRSYPTDFTNG